MFATDRLVSVDIAVIGAGAAGLAAAIFAARRLPGCAIIALDGAAKLGAKILVAGGGRCNVTNATVTPGDFCGGSSNAIRKPLRAFTVEQTVAFFREIGVELHEEEHGKLFPNTHRARTVLEALVAESRRQGVDIRAGHRVNDVARDSHGFRLSVSGQPGSALHARRVVLATGGMSLPKTGSDGGGYRLAQGLGHGLVPTTPALAPLVLEGDWHRDLAGVAQEVELAVASAGSKSVRIRGAMLWTHFGVSGPAVLDVSRHWHRAVIDRCQPSVTANLLPGEDFESAERRFLEFAADQPRGALRSRLSTLLPARVADAILARLAIDGQTPLAHVNRDVRRRLIHALLAWPLPVRDSRGYTYAEATAGGVSLEEVDCSTMASRVCPGLHLIGEILDVDGRIGGFNFQWAWSSAYAAAEGLARGGAHG